MANKTKTVMAHVVDGNNHSVAAQLHVLISPTEEGGYVAQGLEIDYCSTGHSIDEVQQNFARGFLMTIETLLKRNRPLGALFKSRTPPEVWQEYIDSSRQDELVCATLVDLSNQMPANSGLPFQHLAFCSPRQLSLA